MEPISYRRHRFPPVIIQPAVWLYDRFTLSYRDVEDLLAERGIHASYETVRRWAAKFADQKNMGWGLDEHLRPFANVLITLNRRS